MVPTMNDRLWKSLLLGLLAAILVSQWATQLLHQRQAAQQLAVLQSIDAQIKRQAESNEELVASLNDLADVVDDIHGHVEGLGE